MKRSEREMAVQNEKKLTFAKPPPERRKILAGEA
jgi:hypothetical protein